MGRKTIRDLESLHGGTDHWNGPWRTGKAFNQQRREEHTGSTAIWASSADTLPQLVTGSSYSRQWSMSWLAGSCPSLTTNLEGTLQLASPQLCSQASSPTQLTLQPLWGNRSSRGMVGGKNKTITSLSSLQSVGNNLQIPNFTWHMLNLKASCPSRTACLCGRHVT